MVRTHKHITAGIAALALALGSAAPAAARPFDLGQDGSTAPAGMTVQAPLQAASHHNSGNGFDWVYAAAGSGAASLALIGIGGTMAGRRQRRTRKAAIAA